MAYFLNILSLDLCRFISIPLKESFNNLHINGKIDVTVSAEISSAEKGNTLESLYEKADKALYAVKHKNTW